MSALDFVLNCAALLLVLNWWGRGWSAPRVGIALVSTLRRAEPPRRDRWRSPAMLGAIVVLRAFFYWQIGPAVRWLPRLSLVAIAVPFRSDSVSRMLLFSVLSMLTFFAAFYFCLLLVSAVNRSLPAHDPWHSVVGDFLGPVAGLPAWIKLLLPFLIGALFWTVCGPLLSRLGMQLPAKSWAHRAEEAVLIGVGAWLSWKYVIAALLILHIVLSYVYLGNAPLWQYINNTGSNLLRPFTWLPLRAGRFDFAPLVGLALLFLAAEFLQGMQFPGPFRSWTPVLPVLYARLPL